MMQQIKKALYKIVHDSIEYPDNQEESAWIAKRAVMHLIENDTALYNNSVLNAFYDSVYSAPMHLLDSALAMYYDSLPMQALDLNSSIEPANDIEERIQAMNDYFIREKTDTASLSGGEITELRSLAGQCPFTYGPAVYMARALLAGIDFDTVRYSNSCEISGSGQRLAKPKTLKAPGFSVYPNPASDQLFVEYNGNISESGKIILYNYIGEEIYKEKISGNLTVVSLSDVPNGIYLCVLKDNDKIKFSQKLIIIK